MKSDMLPLSLMKVGRTSGLPIGSLSQIRELPGADVFVGTFNEFRVAIVFEDGEVWSKNTDDLSGPALWFSELEFETDPTTFAAFDHIDNKSGALAIRDGKVFIAVPPPSKAGHILVQVGEADVTDGLLSYGFTSWRAVVRLGDEVRVLFENVGAATAA